MTAKLPWQLADGVTNAIGKDEGLMQELIQYQMQLQAQILGLPSTALFFSCWCGNISTQNVST